MLPLYTVSKFISKKSNKLILKMSSMSNVGGRRLTKKDHALLAQHHAVMASSAGSGYHHKKSHHAGGKIDWGHLASGAFNFAKSDAMKPMRDMALQMAMKKMSGAGMRKPASPAVRAQRLVNLAKARHVKAMKHHGGLMLAGSYY